MTDTRKVVSATVGPMPRPMPAGMFDPLPKVTVTWDDDETEELFTFYPDEIMFVATELVGLTRQDIRKLFFDKDHRYLTT